MSDKNRKIMNMVIAILVSIGAWVFVVYNYKPMTTVTYSDVPVTFTGETALADRGLAVADTSTESISVTLNQKRVDSGKISADDIVATADVSGCVAGDNTISVTVSSPKDTTVEDVDTDTIDVSVQRTKTETMEIDVVFLDADDDTAEPIAFDLSQLQADVTCTAERMKEVDKLAAVLRFDAVSDNIKSYTTKLKALNKDGEVLPHVVIEPDEISLDAEVGYTKEVSLTVPVKNPKDENYERTYTVPETVVIKGSKDDIDNIGTVRAYEIDLSGTYEDGEIPLEYNLPENVYIAQESLGKTLNYKVTKIETPETEDEDSTDTDS